MGELASHCHEKSYKKRKHKVREKEDDSQVKASLSSIFSYFSLCRRILFTNPKGVSFYIGSRAIVLSLQGAINSLGKTHSLGEFFKILRGTSDVILLPSQICTC